MNKPAAMILLLTLGACGADEPGDGIDDDFTTGDGKTDATGVVDGSPEALAVLRQANSASKQVLDDDIGLDSRAAENIVAHRLGADGLAGTGDDRRFATLAELDAVPYVGRVAFQRLLDYATSLTWREALPATFELEVSVEAPVRQSQWWSGSLYPGNETITSTVDTVKSFHVLLTGTDASVGVQLGSYAGGGYGTVAAIADDGTFILTTSSSGVSDTSRTVSFEKSTLQGRIDGLGTLTITDYRKRSGGGNSLYGYKGLIVELAGKGFTVLP